MFWAWRERKARSHAYLLSYALDIPEFAAPEEKLLIVLDALNAIKDALDDITFEVEHKELDHAVDLVERAVDSIGEVVDELEQEEYELDEAMEDSY